ncbi:hypothetical protein [Staphylococcus hsinchuensis]|uniref:Uncharacterized protein n=1 Tax=Staphylococcus hsinchuensis TaxID=3051183 RepID=A0ABZ3E9U7_9STAP
MYKQIFNKSDGAPKLIKTGIFDTEQYTEIQPPNGLYQPIHFDGGEWVGTPYEEWKKSQPPSDAPENESLKKDREIAELSMQLIQSKEEFEQLKNEMASLTLKMLEGETNG